MGLLVMNPFIKELAALGAVVVLGIVAYILAAGYGLVMVMIYCQSNCVASLGG